ncbi:uncharacterized protein LOC122063264 isoform X2 [Macadamia integrifolia]|uniref:uncharacterized protein LOC122063264 isoform X2 n=1 Tax=Macadamia integrifolia TaxID=60698 RepID=UPI001C4F2DF6|nr:uncharacterized protein LOC122063264 isoform X2 [Macadamia integrifolia]
MASIPVILSIGGKATILLVMYKFIEKITREYFMSPSSSVTPDVSVDTTASVVTDLVLKKCPSSLAPHVSADTVSAIVTDLVTKRDLQYPSVNPDRVSSNEEMFQTLGLKDSKNDDGDEEDEIKEDNVKGDDSLVREAKPRKILYPQRPDAAHCSSYLQTGTCSNGANCRYHHPARKENQVIEVKKEDLSEKKEQKECKSGGCKIGKAHRYNPSWKKPAVPLAPPLDFNFLGLPIRPGERECQYYMRTGSCKYGPNCRFHHPDPTAVGGDDIPSGSVSLHPSGVLQPASTSCSSPLNETVPDLDSVNPYAPMTLPPQQVRPNSKKNGYQATFTHNGKQLLLVANPKRGWSKPNTHPAVNDTCRKGAEKTKIVQSLWCEICKIDCNSKDDLDQHKLGKKHEDMEKLEESKKEASTPAATMAPAAKDPVIGPKESPAVDKGKTVVQSAWCEICKVDCSSKNPSMHNQQHKLDEFLERPGQLECKYRLSCKDNHLNNGVPKSSVSILSPMGDAEAKHQQKIHSKHRSAGKKPLHVSPMTGQNDHYGSLGSGGRGPCRADKVDNWTAGKNTPPTASSMGLGSGFRDTASVMDHRGRAPPCDGDCERPPLVLHPPKGDGVVNELPQATRPSPFGAARPREEVLAEKGLDWRKLDSVFESYKMMSRHTGSQSSSSPLSVQSNSAESPAPQVLGAQLCDRDHERPPLVLDPPKGDTVMNEPPKATMRSPFGAAHPMEEVLDEKDLDWRKLDSVIESLQALRHRFEKQHQNHDQR